MFTENIRGVLGYFLHVVQLLFIFYRQTESNVACCVCLRDEIVLEGEVKVSKFSEI